MDLMLGSEFVLQEEAGGSCLALLRTIHKESSHRAMALFSESL